MGNSYGVIIPFADLSVIGERPEVLVALLKRVVDCRCNIIEVTYDELAKECGYANRSGVWKYIQKLITNGIVKQHGRKALMINFRMVI